MQGSDAGQTYSLLPLTSRQLAPGIWRMQEFPLDSIEQAQNAAWTTLELDLALVSSKSELLARLADAGSFPKQFGHNWDAAADFLQDLSWLDGHAYVLFVSACEPFQSENSSLATVLIDVLVETVEYWADKGVPFQVLWEAGPDRRSVASTEPRTDTEDAMASFPVDGAHLGSVAAWPTPST